ncbi:MAG: hypothetical protein WB392_08950 [Methanotrichaceae archaeon]
MARNKSIKLNAIVLLLDDKGHSLTELNHSIYGSDELGNLSTTLKPLIVNGIIYQDSHRRTEQAIASQKYYRETPLYLAKSINGFRFICDLIMDMKKELQISFWDILFNSTYMNTLIKENGLIEIYPVIEADMADREFHKLSSRLLLSRPAVLNEYEDKSKFFNGDINLYHNAVELWKLGIISKPKYHKNSSAFSSEINNLDVWKIQKLQVGLLGKFYPLNAIPLYRDTMHKKIQRLFVHLCESSLISRGLCLFMQLDNYLTPFTSYPANSLNRILFSHPFERISEEAFLFGEEDLLKLRMRAFVVYNHFSDLLYEHFKNQSPHIQRGLDRLTKEFIHDWNVSCYNFDFVYGYLSEVFTRKLGSETYYIYRRDDDLIVYDLKNSTHIPVESIIEPEDDIPITVGGYTDKIRLSPYEDYDPYTELKPCSCFKDMPDYSYNRKTIDRLVMEVKGRLDNYRQPGGS